MIFIKSCQGFQVILGYVCYLKFDVGNVSFDINVSLNIFYFINLGSRNSKLIDQKLKNWKLNLETKFVIKSFKIVVRKP